MNKRFFALMTILIAIIAVLVGLYASGVFLPKTDFDTKFISGTIYGDAILNKNYNRYNNWSVNYIDKSNNISYTFLIVKDGTFLMDVFKFSGFQKVESKSYNNVEWNVYFLKTLRSSNVPDENSNISDSPIFYYNYLCTTNQNGTDYFILLLSPKVTGSTSLNSDLFSNHVKPLLETIELKNIDYVPTVQELLKSTR